MINQVYLANIDLLKQFIFYFKQVINQSKALKIAYEIQYDLNYQTNDFAIKQEDDICFNHNESFIKSLSKENKLFHELTLMHKDHQQSISLTPQQEKCFLLLLEGLSAKQIAMILNISYRTVEHHITRIKKNLGCRNLKELLTFYSCQIKF